MDCVDKQKPGTGGGASLEVNRPERGGEYTLSNGESAYLNLELPMSEAVPKKKPDRGVGTVGLLSRLLDRQVCPTPIQHARGLVFLTAR